MSSSGKSQSTASGPLTGALLQLAVTGCRPRCSDPETHGYWLSEAKAERDQAVAWCSGCPILDNCRQNAELLDEPFGVWGGVDRTKRPAKTREIRATR